MVYQSKPSTPVIQKGCDLPATCDNRIMLFIITGKVTTNSNNTNYNNQISVSNGGRQITLSEILFSFILYSVQKFFYLDLIKVLWPMTR